MEIGLRRRLNLVDGAGWNAVREPNSTMRFRRLLGSLSYTEYQELGGDAGAAARLEYEDAHTWCIEEAPVRRGAAPTCPACGERVGTPEWLAPYRVELQTEGRVYGDLAFGPGDGSFLASARFRRMWHGAGLTGIAFSGKVEIAWVSHFGGSVSGRCPRYFRATIATAAAVDAEASGIEWLDEPPCCSWCRLAAVKSWRGIVVDRSTWTGEDVFALRGIAAVMVTERFAQWCERHHIRNAPTLPEVA